MKICSMITMPPIRVAKLSPTTVMNAASELRSTCLYSTRRDDRPLGAGGADVVELDDVQDAGAQKADLRRDQDHHHRHRGHDQMNQVPPEVAVGVDVAARGQPPQRHREQQHQQDRPPVGGQAVAHHRQRADAAVHQRALALRATTATGIEISADSTVITSTSSRVMKKRLATIPNTGAPST